MSVRYSRSRVPRSFYDFPHSIATDVPIAPSGQLCFDVTMPRPEDDEPEFGVLLVQVRQPGVDIAHSEYQVRFIVIGDDVELMLCSVWMSSLLTRRPLGMSTRRCVRDTTRR